MDLMSKLRNRAFRQKRKIVLPEGEEERIIVASSIILKDDLASLILIGNSEIINAKANELNVDISKAVIIDPNKSDKTGLYTEKLYEFRKHKGLTREEAQKLIYEDVYFATMMLKLGEVDGLVGGAIHTTSDLLRPALQIIKTLPGISTVSAFFVMDVPNCEFGENGVFLFADCGLNQYPNAEQLAAIAMQTAESARNLCDMEPRVALLSHSTKGSAEHESIDTVREALNIVRNTNPQLIIDGELQLDAAIIPEVSKRKAPDSPVAGRANVLVFPNLDAGNIGYKLVERLAKATATGPICQGLAKPVNDLSRGCSADDIVNVILVTCAQVQNNN